MNMQDKSQLEELIKETVKRIETKEGRSRSRTADEQLRLEHATRVLRDIAKSW